MDFQKLIEQAVLFPKPDFAPQKPTKEYSYDKFNQKVSTFGEGETVILGDRECQIFRQDEYKIEEIEPSRHGLKEVWATGSILEKNSSGRFFRDYLAGRVAEDGLGCLYRVPNIGNDGLSYRYFTGPKRARATKGKYYQGVPVDKEEGQQTDTVIPNFWELADSFGNCRHEGQVDFRSGKKPEAFIEKIFDVAIAGKSDAWTLEPFAGSASMTAVSHKKGFRWIAIELGEYFQEKTLRRLKHVLNGDESGIEHAEHLIAGTGIFKYCNLETYEDALTNLALADRSPDLLGQPQELQDDYLLCYCLDTETNGSLLDCEQFKDPFNYQLKIYDRESGEAKPTKVDLPETFNYLLGLKVRTMQMKEETLVIEGENPAGETVLVIWRNVESMDNKKLEKFVSKTLRINTADTEYAAIYINGDTTLNDPHKKILLTEQVFHDLMFDVEDA